MMDSISIQVNHDSQPEWKKDKERREDRMMAATRSKRTRSSGRPRKRKGLLFSDQAYEELKWKILDAELKPGKLYTEAELCEVIKLGRSPVRSALFKLQHDRLIEVVPRKGMFIRPWSSTEVHELTDARLVLEPEIVRAAASRADNDDIKRLKKTLEEGRTHLRNSDRRGLMRVDHEFHTALAIASKNPVFVELVKFLKQRSHSLWLITITSMEKMCQVQEQHEAILQTVVNGDAEGAVAAMKSHLNRITADLPYDP